MAARSLQNFLIRSVMGAPRGAQSFLTLPGRTSVCPTRGVEASGPAVDVILGRLKVCWNKLLEHFPKCYDRKYRSVLIRNGDSIRFYSSSLSETFRNKITNALNSNSAGCFDIMKLGSIRIFDQPALADVKIVSRHPAGTNQLR